MKNAAELSSIQGLPGLWSKTLGHEGIRIAVLDGPVDRSHPALMSARLSLAASVNEGAAEGGPASQHGTQVASIIFGRHSGPVRGIAPGCQGIIIPIFRDGPNGAVLPCSQIDLARAISRAVELGAHIINVSGGQLSNTGTAHPMLTRAVANCAERGALIVAAAGNDGCECLHVPGALDSVLAVGAMNAQGEPMEFSNWGERYQGQGVLALGENVLGAKLGGGTVISSGTSVATPIVSGVAGLLLSLQLMQNQKLDPQGVRRAILVSAIGCQPKESTACRRFLMGRLNINEATKQILAKGGNSMVEERKSQELAQPQVSDVSMTASTSPMASEVQAASYGTDQMGSSNENPREPNGDEENEEESSGEAMESSRGAAQQTVLPTASNPLTTAVPGSVRAPEDQRFNINPQAPSHNRMYPSACSCDGGSSPQLVYALGQLYFDFGTEARRDSLAQSMGLALGAEGEPENPFELLKYLDKNSWDAAAVIWTLNDETTPIYAIQPDGPYARETFTRLQAFLREQLEEGVERVSIPGFVAGKVRLYTGQEVPVIYPELRGMYSWTTKALVEAVSGAEPKETASDEEKRRYSDKSEEMRSFLDRVYYDIRNLGLDPRDRAINYSATNAFNLEKVFESAMKANQSLDTIEAERSPVCRPDSDCWDVKLIFFQPDKQFEVARKVFRFTVDVSDVVPVLVGDVRQWSIR